MKKLLKLALMVLAVNVSNAQSGNFMGIYEGILTKMTTSIGTGTNLEIPVKITVGDYVIIIESEIFINNRFIMVTTSWKEIQGGAEWYTGQGRKEYTHSKDVRLIIGVENPNSGERQISFSESGNDYTFKTIKIR